MGVFREEFTWAYKLFAAFYKPVTNMPLNLALSHGELCPVWRHSYIGRAGSWQITLKSA